MMPVRLEPAALQSQVKLSTTESLRSNVFLGNYGLNHYMVLRIVILNCYQMGAGIIIIESLLDKSRVTKQICSLKYERKKTCMNKMHVALIERELTKLFTSKMCLVKQSNIYKTQVKEVQIAPIDYFLWLCCIGFARRMPVVVP